MKRRSIGGLTLLCVGLILVSAAAWIGLSGCGGKKGLPEIISREVLFGNPERVSPRLSPDGERMAYIAPEEGVLNVWVRTVGKDDDIAVTHDRGQGIRGYFWAKNNEQILYVQDKDGDENWHVYAVPAGGGDAIDLTPIDGVQARIVAVNEDYPNEIMVSINDRVPQLHDVYRVDIKTGERTLEAQNDLGAVGWIADHDFVLRIAQIPTPDGGFAILHRATPEANWELLMSWGSVDALTTDVADFAGDNQTLYMISSIGSNTAELRAYDIKTGVTEVIAKDSVADAGGLFIHPKTHKVQAVAFTRNMREWKILDPDVEADFAALRKIHAGEIRFSDRDDNDATWLVAYMQDDGPVAYYSYERATKKGTFLFTHRPELEGLPLAKMEPISYTSRDGLTIHGYLTLPIGVKAENLPTVLNIHGGPWYRDTWGYNPEAQWLANRGYACLQINFRGSTGYGKEFVNAGDKEWGGRMQDDITDGAKWIIEQGIADSTRIGIYGGSYGGYAVLSGLTTTPDLYACGVDMVGPSNLISFIQTIPPYWEPLKILFGQRVGNLETDTEFLKSRSPLFFVDRIQAPLFIAQGANDPRVNREESIQIRDALLEEGKVVEYLEFADEGHGFARPENRLKFYAAAERFLEAHLHGRFEPER